MSKMFQITSFKQLGQVVKKYITKFNAYNEKKKKQYAKLGLKSILKMIK